MPGARARARTVASRGGLLAWLLAATLTSAAPCSFGGFIEGAAVTRSGQLFAVNAGGARAAFGLAGSSGSSSTACKPVVADKGAELNSLRVLPSGTVLASDIKNTRVVRISPDGTTTVFCQGGGMIEPNDLALSKAGAVYVSGQRWTDTTASGDGGVWLCRKAGAAPQQLFLGGRTNGIELSPDDKYLFFSEAFNKGGAPASNKIWRVELKPDGFGARTLFADFAALDGSGGVDVDGMRADTAGNLFVTRHGGQSVVQLSPSGKIVKRIQLPFRAPTNLELGGPDGRLLWVVGSNAWGSGSGSVASFPGQPAPGRAWSMLQQGLPAGM